MTHQSGSRALKLFGHNNHCTKTVIAKQTSSSAVAKRPRNASCLSVVSFNSTKRRVEFYCYLRRLQICHCMQLNALFCCLWHNIEASCHKNFMVFSGNQHRRLLPPATVFTTPACCSVNTGSQGRHRLRIAISAYSTCIRFPR